MSVCAGAVTFVFIATARPGTFAVHHVMANCLQDALLAPQQKAGKAHFAKHAEPAAHATAAPSSSHSAAQQQLPHASQASPTMFVQFGTSPTQVQSPAAFSGIQVQQDAGQHQTIGHIRGPASSAQRDEDQAQPAPAEEHPSASGSSHIVSSSVQQQQLSEASLHGAHSSAALQQGQVQIAARSQSDGSYAAEEERDLSTAAANADDADTSASGVQPFMHSGMQDQPGSDPLHEQSDVNPDHKEQHAQQVAFELQQQPPSVLPAPLPPVNPQHHKRSRGQSVYAAKDYTALERYEADLAKAYAASFVTEAIMQHTLPTAANTVVSEQHRAAVAEVQRRNAELKQLHLEEVKVERAAWQRHEEEIHR